ncbi:prolactin receptor-like isoform X1 [Carassius carassius]|uniref:prolactin receptor-like isoform X1 n=2 Tax=Carassius carassius TaxID=217509 RepID=UPI002869699C|nr:prolactin receptor-like isoform X1 [Carassius carassius]
MFVSRAGKMWRDAEQALTLMLLLSWISHSMCHSPPGRPRITRCRSPEKETFTCWWEPGSTGGLPSSYHLYYRKESSLEVSECPDYHKAGNNSCYFDKRHTSLWITYNITVVASNALGEAYSESVEVDVMDIVQSHPPENVNVTLMQTTNSPYFLVQWQPPHDADTRSGWVTIKYEVRLKIENRGNEEDSNWESYSAGKQLEFSIYSPQPGANYIVQVRCKLDQGLWSEWSPSAFIQIPDNTSDTQNAFIIIAVTLMVIIFLLTAGVLTVKMKLVKHFLLPPIPEPKISGLDTRLLKSGKSEEIFSALITPGYPQIAQRSDRQVDYLVVSDYDEEMDFNGKAHLECQKGENCLKDTAQKVSQNSIQITLNSSQDLSTTLSEHVYPGTVSNQLSATSSVLGEPRQLLYLNCNGSPEKAHDQNALISSGSKCENVSINPAGLMGYVEVDEEKRDQTPLVGEDYSMVTDVISDNILVLQDSIPIQGHKEVKCDKTFKAEETGGVFEPLGYLETLTTFLRGS